MTRPLQRLATPLLCLSLCLPAQADDAARIVGGILGAIVNEQSRQQQQREMQRQQQYQQQLYRQQQQPRQNARRQPAAAPQPQQPRMSLSQRKAVQRALREAGFYHGEIDGALGPGSRKAIAAWQDSVGATPSGYLAQRQAKTLVAQAPEPEPEPEQDYAQDFAEPDTPAQAGFPEQPETALFPDAPAAQPLFPEAGAAPDPDTFAEAPAGTVLQGEDHLHAAFLFWALSRAPEQMWEPRLAAAYRDIPLADGAPAARGLQPEALRPLIEDAVRHYGQNPPRSAVLEVPLPRRQNDRHETGMVQRATHWLPDFGTRFTDISGVKAITDWRLQGTGRQQLLLASDKPFFLALPDDHATAWAQPTTDPSRALLRVEMALDQLQPSADLAGYPMGRARMTVQRASLVLISEQPKGTRQERVLHVWSGEAPETRKLDRPETAAEIAAIYGVTEQGGRVLTTPLPQTRASRNKPQEQPRALLADRNDYGMVREALPMLDQALRLAALVEAGPDRPFDPQLTRNAASTLLSQRERVELLPTALAISDYSAGMSELTVRKALMQAEPQVRQLIAGRAPLMPLPLRAVMMVRLGDYDFESGGFPLELQRQPAAWMPPIFHKDGESGVMPRFFRIEVDSAEKLLAHLEQVGKPGNRSVYLISDYLLTGMRARPGATGPITEAELETVALASHVEAMALFADPAGQSRIRDLPVPEALAAAADTPAAGDLPDEIFATSGKSLMAAVAVRHLGALEAGMLDPHDIANLPEDQRGSRAQDYRAGLPGLARDRYWIAATMQVEGYDPDLGGFPTRHVLLEAVPYARDLSGVMAPTVQTASRADYELLRVPAEQAEAVAALTDDSGNLHMFLHVPVADARVAEGEHPALHMGAPTEAILGRSSHATWPDAGELRVSLAAPDRLAWVLADPERPTGAPKALLLDPEGLDLLALAQESGLYDDDAYRRMLLERMAKERIAAKGTPLRLDWGRFFRDPSRQMEPSALDAMLPAFRSWTAARVALLPQQVVLPVTTGGRHPLTGCDGARELGGSSSADQERLFRANAPLLLGQPLPGVDQLLVMHGTRPRPGPTRFWTVASTGRAPGSACPFLQESDPVAGGYADLLLQVETQPELARTNAQALVAAGYALELTDRRLVPAADLTDVPQHLRGVLVLKASVQAVDLFSHDKAGTPAVVGRLQPGDWQAVTGTPPAAQDVLGMTLGMTLAEFDKAARAHLPQADAYVTVKPGKGPFGTASGYLDPATGEALAAIYAAQSPDKTVVAIMRQLEFPEAEIALDGLKASLIEKYGPAIIEYRDRQWAWGTLPQDEDSYGFCGGQSTFNPMSAEGQPELGTTDPAARERGRLSQRGDARFWQLFGWPSVALAGQGAEPDLARCGPVVTVTVEPHARPDTVMLRLWLTNRKLAEDLATAAAPAEPPKPKVRF